MLDIKALRADAERFLGELKKRNAGLGFDELLNLDKARREKLAAVEKLKNQRNTVSKEVGRLKAEGQDASGLVEEMKEVNAEIKRLDEDIRKIEEEVNGILLYLPNLPHESVPVGADEEANQVVRSWGSPREFLFPAKAHWELGEDLDILKFEWGANQRRSFYRLERAGRPVGKGAGQFYAGFACPGTRIHRDFPAVSGKKGYHDRNKPVAQI